jgi:hypothetical protein
VRHRRAQRGDGHACADMQHAALTFDLLQVAHSVEEGDGGEVAQLFRHPKTHIGCPCDQRGVGMGEIPVGKVVRGWGGRPHHPAPHQPRWTPGPFGETDCIQSGTGAVAAASAARMIGA